MNEPVKTFRLRRRRGRKEFLCTRFHDHQGNQEMEDQNGIIFDHMTEIKELNQGYRAWRLGNVEGICWKKYVFRPL